MRDFTVFVVGAGASYEAGLPTGKTLVAQIINKLSFEVDRGGTLSDRAGDQDILNVVRQLAKRGANINDLLKAAWRVRDGARFANSIDTFMNAHADDSALQICAKLGIVKCILEAERNSALFVKHGTTHYTDMNVVLDAWYGHLFRHISDGVKSGDLGRLFEKVKFIVFNYDRCVESFLYYAIQNLYGVHARVAAEIMSSLVILHPYGTIGALKWQDERGGIDFGDQINSHKLELMSSQIKTFTERIETPGTLDIIKNVIASASTLVFLGFSYHRLNLDLLDPGRVGKVNRVLGTSFGLSTDYVGHVRVAIRALARKDLTIGTRISSHANETKEGIDLPPISCSQLISQYSGSLFVAGPP